MLVFAVNAPSVRTPGVDIRDMMQDWYALPVDVENDVQAISHQVMPPSMDV